MNLNIERYNDGKCKFQSEELYIGSSFSEFGAVYGCLDVTIYGDSIDETSLYKDEFIDLLVSELLKLKEIK